MKVFSKSTMLALIVATAWIPLPARAEDAVDGIAIATWIAGLPKVRS